MTTTPTDAEVEAALRRKCYGEAFKSRHGREMDGYEFDSGLMQIVDAVIAALSAARAVEPITAIFGDGTRQIVRTGPDSIPVTVATAGQIILELQDEISSHSSRAVEPNPNEPPLELLRPIVGGAALGVVAALILEHLL